MTHPKSEEKGNSIFPKKIRYISYLDNNSIKIKLKGGLKIEQIDLKFFYILITSDRYISYPLSEVVKTTRSCLFVIIIYISR